MRRAGASARNNGVNGDDAPRSRVMVRHDLFLSSSDSDSDARGPRSANPRSRKRQRTVVAGGGCGSSDDASSGHASDDGFIKLAPVPQERPTYRFVGSGIVTKKTKRRSSSTPRSKWSSSDDDGGSSGDSDESSGRTASAKRARPGEIGDIPTGAGQTLPPAASAPWWMFSPTGRIGFRSFPNKSLMLRLHEEVLSLAALLRPTLEESRLATALRQRIVGLVRGLWPKAEVKQFGSRSTGLELPTSDVDLVIFGVTAQRGLHRLGAAIRSANFADHLEVIAKAKVPIVKFRDRDSQLYVDVCFEQVGSIRTVAMAKQLFQEQPILRPLVVVLKYFLLQRDLNETYTGGVGSYLLLLMCMRVLQLRNQHTAQLAVQANPALAGSGVAAETDLAAASAASAALPPADDEELTPRAAKRRRKKERKRKKKERAAKAAAANGRARADAVATAARQAGINLGVLLMDFLELYGFSLNFVTTGISVRGQGSFFTKRSRSWFDPSRPFLLSVENPDSPELDVGRNAYGIVRVRKAFDHARRRLVAAFYECTSDRYRARGGSGVSLLACVITMDAFLSERGSRLQDQAGIHGRLGFSATAVGDGNGDDSDDDGDDESRAAPVRRPAYFYRDHDADKTVAPAAASVEPTQDNGASSAAATQATKDEDDVALATSHGDSQGSKEKTEAGDSGGAPDLPVPAPATDATAPTTSHNITLRRPRLIADLKTRTARLKRMAEEEAAAAKADAEAGVKHHWP